VKYGDVACNKFKHSTTIHVSFFVHVLLILYNARSAYFFLQVILDRKVRWWLLWWLCPYFDCFFCTKKEQVEQRNRSWGTS